MEHKEKSFSDFAGEMGIMYIFVAIFMYPFYKTDNAFWIFIGGLLMLTLGIATFVCLCAGAGSNDFERFWVCAGIWAAICSFVWLIEWVRRI
jgi:hypothetical protein